MIMIMMVMCRGKPGSRWADDGDGENAVDDEDDDEADDVDGDGDDDGDDGDVLGDNLGGLMASISRSEFSRGQLLY